MQVLTIGNFDGVHLGHRAILARARSLAGDTGRVIALPFDPHPATVLRPDVAPPRLMSRDRKIAALQAAGVDDVHPLAPTPDLLEQTPQQFIEQLVARYDADAFVEGGDFHFGKGREGNLALLKQLGQAHGFSVEEVGQVEASLHDQILVPISSSLVRWLVEMGRVADAGRCLGRPFSLTAPIVHGEKRGRRIGVPTANLDLDALSDYVIPAPGVYAALAATQDGSAVHAAAVSVGVKPTFGQRRLVIEAHLLDFEGDLYDQRLTLSFTHWLRDQHPFPHVDLLRAQLQRDIARTRMLSDAGMLEAAGA